MFEWIGWVATALFGVSYLCKQANVLRAVQAVAALMWISYGLIIHANPVVVANLIVAVMAAGSVALQLQHKKRENDTNTIGIGRTHGTRGSEAGVGGTD